MPKFVKVATRDQIPPGGSKFVMGPFEKPMALFHVDGECYALNFICPHQGGPLGDGTLDGYLLTCPWHDWSFDVRTGAPDHPGGHWTHAYEVRVEGDDILVGWLKGSFSAG